MKNYGIIGFNEGVAFFGLQIRNPSLTQWVQRLGCKTKRIIAPHGQRVARLVQNAWPSLGVANFVDNKPVYSLAATLPPLSGIMT